MIVKSSDVPVQETEPLVYVGVTVTVPEIGAVPEFVAVNDKLPVPLTSRPIAELVLVHAYVVVPSVLTEANVTVALAALQKTLAPGLVTLPVGLTFMVNVLVEPEQATPL